MLQICSGLFLSDRQNQVDIEMFGLPADTIRKGVHKTRCQPGPHPKWENPNEEFLFEKVNYFKFILCAQIQRYAFN